ENQQSLARTALAVGHRRPTCRSPALVGVARARARRRWANPASDQTRQGFHHIQLALPSLVSDNKSSSVRTGGTLLLNSRSVVCGCATGVTQQQASVGISHTGGRQPSQ